MKELSSYKSEIAAAKSKMSEMESRLTEHEKTGHFAMLHQFLSHEFQKEVLPQINESLVIEDDAERKIKVQLYEDQKALNEVDYDISQR